MGKSNGFKLEYTRENGTTAIDGQPLHTRKNAKHRAKQLSDSNFKLQDFVIVHPDGTREAIELQ